MIWVAEVGSAHKGTKSLAYEFIRVFSGAGADIIKFQFGWTKEAQEIHGHVYNPVRFVDDWAPDLKKWCDSFGVELMASIWSMAGLEAARSVDMERYKVSVQLKDEALLEEIYNDGKEVYNSAEGIYVVPKYPTYPEDLNMPEAFDDEVFGYSDHSHGIEACLLAVARGATYIEKHVCLDKSDLITRDTPFSATPEEYAEMVRLGRGMRRLMEAEA